MSKIIEILENKKHYGGITLTERMQACHTPAISIAVVERGRIETAYAHGVKRKRTRVQVDADTLFQAASLSKPVFAVAVMRLVERGVLDLDADVATYLNGFVLPTFDGQPHKVTLRQILSHHGGLNVSGFVGYQLGQKIPTIEQILMGSTPANSPRLKVVAEPGSAFSYSGGGYILTQRIAMDACGKDFDQLMQDLVLTPFGMTHSGYLQPLPANLRDQCATGYNFYNLQLPGGFNSMPELAAAGLWTTPTDIAQFGIEMMSAANGRSALLKQSTAKTMTTKVSENAPCGLGFFIGESKKGPTFGHSGANFGYYSNMLFCPEDGSGVVAMVNADLGDAIPDQVTQAFREAYGW